MKIKYQLKKKVNVLLPLFHLSKKIEKEEKYLIEENRKKNKICEALGKKKIKNLINQILQLEEKNLYMMQEKQLKRQN